MKKLKYKLDRKTLETLFTSFLHPTMKYGCVVWDSCDLKSKEMLENILLETAQIVTGAIKGTLHNELYKETGWKTSKNRRTRQKLLLFHSLVPRRFL